LITYDVNFDVQVHTELCSDIKWIPQVSGRIDPLELVVFKSDTEF